MNFRGRAEERLCRCACVCVCVCVLPLAIRRSFKQPSHYFTPLHVNMLPGKELGQFLKMTSDLSPLPLIITPAPLDVEERTSAVRGPTAALTQTLRLSSEWQHTEIETRVSPHWSPFTDERNTQAASRHNHITSVIATRRQKIKTFFILTTPSLWKMLI